MSIYKLAGKTIPPDTAFRHEDIQYPANWIRLATPEQREALGVMEIDEQPRPDDRFYWVAENGDGSFTTTPKDLSKKKEELTAHTKQIAGNILGQTDWKVVREVETGKEVDEETSGYRAAIRAASNAHEANIAACQSIEQLAELQINWPKAPWENERPL